MGSSRKVSERVSKLITPLSDAELKAWTAQFPAQRYRQGEELFYRDHFPCGVFVIQSGALDLYFDKRSKTPPHRVGPGCVVGLRLFRQDASYPASAIVAEELHASFVGRSIVVEWLEKKSSLLPKAFRDQE